MTEMHDSVTMVGISKLVASATQRPLRGPSGHALRSPRSNAVAVLLLQLPCCFLFCLGGCIPVAQPLYCRRLLWQRLQASALCLAVAAARQLNAVGGRLHRQVHRNHLQAAGRAAAGMQMGKQNQGQKLTGLQMKAGR